LRTRGLLLVDRWPEQRKLLSLLELETPGAISQLATRVSRRYAENFRWVEKLDDWTKTCGSAEGQNIGG
jgi:predicted transcriptional regulator